MTDVDTSFYPRPQPINPLTMFGDVQAIGGQMLANRQAQQGIQSNQMELNAKNALMQANAEATNTDGTINVNKRNMLLSQTLGGGLHLQDLAVGALPLNAPTSFMGNDTNGNPQQQYRGAQGMAAQLNPQEQQAAQTAHLKVDALSDTITGLLQKPDLTAKDVCSATGDLCADGHLTPQEGAVELQGMPQSPDQIRGWLMGHYQNLKQSKAALNQIAPQGSVPPPTPPRGTTPAGPEADKAITNLWDNPAGQPPHEQSMYAKPEVSSPTVAAAPPVGYTGPLPEATSNYNQDMKEAKDVPNQLASYNEVINLNNAGTLTGTRLADAYKSLAKNLPGLDPNVTGQEAQREEIAKNMARALIAGGLGSTDEKLNQIQSGNLNDEQIPEAIKEMAPMFKAISEGAKAKQVYINKATKNGTDLSGYNQASQQWNQNYDPRLIEYSGLPDKQSKLTFLQKHPDLKSAPNEQKLNTLKSMGIIGGK